MDSAEDEVARRHLLEIGLPQEEDIAGNDYKSVIFYKQFILDIIALIYLIIPINQYDERIISPKYSEHSIYNRCFLSRSPPPRGSRVRGRSPDRYGRSGPSNSPDRIRRRSFSRSRSRSPTYTRPRIQVSPDPPGYVPSAKAPRCRDYDEKGNI